MKATTPIVVMRSNDYCFLGIHRGLAEAGAARLSIDFDWEGSGPWYSSLSRHVGEAEGIPNPYQHSEAAVGALESLGERWTQQYGQRLLVIPSSDTNLMVLLDHWERLSPYFKVMGTKHFESSPIDVIRKERVSETFEREGVAAPFTRRCLGPDEIARAADEVPMPCVFKPVVKDYGQSFYTRHAGLKAIECKSRDELVDRLPAELDAGFELVVQEKIPFGDVHEEIPFYCYVDADHEIRMAATGIKEQIQPPPYGTATVLRLSWHEELLAPARRVAKALRYHGILMIEFIRDARDGVWKVIEVNARPWLAVDFYRRCGLNYLGMAADDIAGRSAQWPEIVVPGDAMLARDPVHVLLSTAVEPHLRQLRSPIRSSDVAGWIEEVPGEKSLALYDVHDPEPGLAEQRALATQFGIDPDDLIRALGPLASGY